mmetsp:Transcript_34600/g.99355  ORF Transcript_34600/g.99355 Transcript_34600/m.99355 type:complete len:251 (-) Transcript_34600:795-1547(-)
MVGLDQPVHVVVSLLQQLLHGFVDHPWVVRGHFQALHLTVDLEQDLLLGLGGARDSKSAHKCRAGGRIDQQGQAGHARDEEQDLVGLVFSDVLVDPADVHLHGEGQAHGAPEPAPGHDGRFLLADWRSGLAQVTQERPGAKDNGASHEGGHHVQKHQVQEIHPTDLRKDLASESSCKEENDRVPQVLQHVPDLMQPLLLNNGRPHLVREHERGGDGAQHPADVQQAFGEAEAGVGAADGQRRLNQVRVVL